MLTVRTFLETEPAAWYKVLYGESLLDTKEIEHISVTEYPVENFVKKNEMILSTAAGLDDEDRFYDFVKGLHESGASALFIARPSDSLHLPDRVMQYLEEYAPFPLIHMPWGCRFADITKSVLDLLREDAITEHNQFTDVQNQLLQAYLSNQPLKQAAVILSRFFQGKVVILDANDEIKGQSHPTSDKKRLLSDITLAKNHSLYPIAINNYVYGNVYIEPFLNGSSFDKNLFTHYLSWPLALWFDKEWVLQTSNQNLKDDFILEMTRAKPEDFDNLNEKAHNLGLDLRKPYFCIVGNVFITAADVQPVSDLWIRENIVSLKEEILRISHQCQWETLVTYQQGELILFIEYQDTLLFDVCIDTLWKRLHKVFPDIYFTWGISEPSDNPPNFGKLFHNAKIALGLCEPMIGQNAFLKFKRTALHNVLSYLSADPEMMKTIQAILTPVYEHDRLMSSDDLITTLKCYLECKNLSEASRILFLHRHSLTYRLNKIEELTGLSLKNPDDFFLLELCVRVGHK